MAATLVQALSGHDETGSNVTSLSTNAGSAFSAGQYVVGSFLYLGNLTPVQSDILYITDGTHTYPIIDYVSTAAGCGVATFFGPATAGATTITLKLAGSGETFVRLMCHVISGVSGQIDGHSQSFTQNLPTTTMTTPSLTTTAAGDYVYAYILNDFNSWGTATASSPFTEENHFNNAGAGTEVAVDAFDVQSVAGAISATFTGTASGSGVDVTYGIIALKAGSAQKVVALTSSSTSPWTLPADWPGTADAVYVIGAGGNGSARVSTTRGGSGGGGGACVYAFNYAMSSNPTFSIGAAGSAANTTFDSSAFVAAHGTTGTTSVAGAGGTTVSSTVPTGGTEVAGGGGFLPPTSNAEGGGGGGAGGPDGAGIAAASNLGGNGDNGATVAPAVGTNGTAGTQWTATAGGNFGPGSGGSGFASGIHTGTAGGQYGGGASGASDGSTSAGGSGGEGLVVIVYTPAAAADTLGQTMFRVLARRWR